MSPDKALGYVGGNTDSSPLHLRAKSIIFFVWKSFRNFINTIHNFYAFFPDIQLLIAFNFHPFFNTPKLLITDHQPQITDHYLRKGQIQLCEGIVKKKRFSFFFD
jgi:hypothetical protein